MSNFIKQADGSYSDVGSIGAKVVDDTEDFGISSTAAPPVCSDYTSESTCIAAGCDWRDGACYGYPPEYEIPWVIILAAVGGVIAIIGAVVLIRR